jgi:hypothetical protein
LRFTAQGKNLGKLLPGIGATTGIRDRAGNSIKLEKVDF